MKKNTSGISMLVIITCCIFIACFLIMPVFNSIITPNANINSDGNSQSAYSYDSNSFTHVHASGSKDTIIPFNILCICSYNYSYDTVPQHIQGIEAGLGDLSYEITYENMDAKRFYEADDIQEFYNYLSYKIDKIDAHYDLIFVIDDTALRFVINYRNELFGDVPVVFMGINSVSDATTSAALHNVTGISETLDFESNYDLMKALFPDRNEIVVLCDGSNTSSGEYVEFLKFTENHPEISYRVLNASYYTQKGLKRALSELDNNNIIYYLEFSQDGDGNLYTINSASSFVDNNVTNVPVIRLTMANCTNNILGGISYSYTHAGEVAGKMAGKILNGVSADNIALISDTITESYFYQDKMDEFGIKSSQLPADSYIANERFNPIRYYQENALILNLIILIIILLFIIIVIQAKANRQHERMLNNDYLTQIPNRHYINQKIDQLNSTFTPYGLAMIDVDHFKDINDTYGHLVGDEVLVEISTRFSSIASKYITFARIGGDEFMMLITGPEIDNADNICRQIQNIIRNAVVINKKKLEITLSIGCALYPSDTNDPTQIMALADRALYYVKENGRNDYKLFGDL
ncbi:ABC transporter substrate binding protein [Butyrivibrio sp. TB]|uniref:ABC transporter substrate binding protein n=1 Tax=Butyrivibrio sp. TB TaxID=1520809 RepID=UPI0008CC789D|nr:ABC transporter substrate binding protein [Butyrivibrio sp. TB]SEQ01554.1 diguanylate cyclase (GGDEF) domain-containing protein [Butyrivibrio sp. TB]